MKKGFTLAELLGVIIIISLLTIIILPPVINQIKKMQGSVSDVALSLISSATELFMDGKKSTYSFETPTTYCITLGQLVDDGKLEEPIIDTATGNVISLNKIVKVVVTTSVNITYSIVDTCP